MADKNDEVGGLGLDEDESKSDFVLISKESKQFRVNKAHVKISKLIQTTVEQDPTATEVNIFAVDNATMELIVSYAEHHKGTEPPVIDKPLRSRIMADVCKDKWDAEFIDKVGQNLQCLYDLILAANYMDIKALLHLGCAKVASLIKGQPLERIKDILAVKS